MSEAVTQTGESQTAKGGRYQLFDRLRAEEYQALKADIAAHGLLTPITVHKGAVIDGRNRLQACQELGVEPRFQEWNGDGDLLAFILSANLHRRHLSESQRALIAARIANMEEGRPRKTTQIYAVSQSDAAKLLHTSVRELQMAKEVLSSAPDLVQKIDAGELTIHAAIIELKKRIATEAIDKLKPVEGKFDIIVIDPPWSYGGEYNEQGHRVASPYPEMPIEQLRALKLPATVFSGFGRLTSLSGKRKNYSLCGALITRVFWCGINRKWEWVTGYGCSASSVCLESKASQFGNQNL